MHAHKPLIDAILADPHAEAPRLAYAAALEKDGDRDRAEFIRLQCEEERLRREYDRAAYHVPGLLKLWDRIPSDYSPARRAYLEQQIAEQHPEAYDAYRKALMEYGKLEEAIANNTFKPLLDRLGFDPTTTHRTVDPLQRINRKRTFFNLHYRGGLAERLGIICATGEHGNPLPAETELLTTTLRDYPTVSIIELMGSHKGQYTEYFNHNPYLGQIRALHMEGPAVMEEGHARELLDINGFKNLESIAFGDNFSMKTILEFLSSPRFPKLQNVTVSEGRYNDTQLAKLRDAVGQKRAAIAAASVSGHGGRQ